MPIFDQEAVNPRIFVVGCSRSGTTLLQTLIASHPEVTTFPETNFFLPPDAGNIRAKIEGLLKILTKKDLKKTLLNPPFSYEKRVKTYLSILDRITLQKRNKKIWVEKTPRHIFNVDVINQYVPKALVVYIIRDGREVVSSIVKRAKEYGKQFKYQDIDYAIELWNKSTRIIEKRRGAENGYIIKYEDMVNEPKKTMLKLGNFVHLDYSSVEFNNREKVLKNARMKDESWKDGVDKNIKSRNNKFESYFSAQERAYICKNLTINSFYKF